MIFRVSLDVRLQATGQIGERAVKPSSPQIQRAIYRGARWGALLLGLLSFLCGLTVCIYFRLPVPPVFVTEIGVMLGAGLGALVGYVSCFPGGRACLRGLALGCLAGLPLALALGSPGLLVGCVTLGLLLGYQSGHCAAATASPGWKLHLRE